MGCFAERYIFAQKWLRAEAFLYTLKQKHTRDTRTPEESDDQVLGNLAQKWKTDE